MSIRRNLAYHILSNVLTVIFPFITVPYISRVLDPDGVGLANFASMYATNFGVFAMLGVGTYGMREISKHRNDPERVSQIFSELFRITIICTVITSLVYIASVFAVPQLRADRWIILLAGFSLFLSPMMIDWYFTGLEQFRLMSVRSVVVRVLCIVAMFIFVRDRADIIAYVVITAVSVTGNNVWNMIWARRHGLKIKWRALRLRPHWRPLLILFGVALAGQMFSMFDTVMLGFLSDYEQVGYYTSAIRPIRMMMPLLLGLSGVLIPRISHNLDAGVDSSHLIQKAFDFMSFFCIPSMVGLFLMASRFVPWFFGVDFIGSIVPMRMLTLLILAVGISNSFGVQGLLARGMDGKYLIIVVSSAVINVLGNLLLIPSWGAAGASLSSVVAECAGALVSIYLVWRFTPIRLHAGRLWMDALCTLPFVGVWWLCDGMISANTTFVLAMVAGCGLCYGALQLWVVRGSLLRLYILKRV